METKSNQTEDKTTLLKDSRLELLRLHKLLVDIERGEYEVINGHVSSRQFLNLLLNEDGFQWLRKFSTLIVDIDEMLDLDDGFSSEMTEKHLTAMKEIVELKSADDVFNKKYQEFLKSQPEIRKKNEEIKSMLS